MTTAAHWKEIAERDPQRIRDAAAAALRVHHESRTLVILHYEDGSGLRVEPPDRMTVIASTVAADLRQDRRDANHPVTRKMHENAPSTRRGGYRRYPRR